jgi:hypothetical protein
MTKISALSDIGTSVASNDAFVLVDVSDPTTPNKKIQQQNLFLIPDGSAGTPAVRFLNDTDVGLFRPTTNTLALATGGSERLRIDSSGRVGIGTSSPSYKLHVVTDAISGRQDPTNISRTSGNLIRFTNPQFSTDASMGLLLRVFPDADSRQGAGIIANGGTNNGSTTLDLFYTDTAGTSKSGLRISDTGAVGIGTTSPGSALEVKAAAPVLTVNSAVANASSIVLQENGTTYARFRFDGNNVDIGNLYVNGATIFNAGNAERARIDSSGRLLVGTASARDNYFNTSGLGGLLQVEGANSQAQRVVSNTYGIASGAGPIVVLAKHRSNSIGGNTVVQSGDYCGELSFQGSDGTEFVELANIAGVVDGTPGASDMPGRLVFSTTADGASSPTERMRITSDAYVRLASGTGGIQFNGDTAAANALDDYEEGTWTPNQGAGLTVVGTFSSVGRYTKVGNLVYVTGYVSGSTSIAIAAGSILCSNLIFTQAIDGCGGNCTNYNVNQTAGLFATGGSTNLYATSALTASISIIFGFTFRV